MSFREMVAQDNHTVFSNTAEFADLRTVWYDGDKYKEVPVTMTQLKEQDRTVVSQKDHAQGIYLVTAIVHFPKDSLGGRVPEKGALISISEDDTFDRKYYVAQSGCDLGMVRLELEAYDE